MKEETYKERIERINRSNVEGLRDIYGQQQKKDESDHASDDVPKKKE